MIVSVATTVGAVLLATMAGYGFSRYNFKGKYTALYTVIIVRMIPGLVYTIPFYIIYQNVGLLNSLTGLLISYITFSLPLAIWLFMGFYDQIPTEVFESAIIDGCNDYGVFRHIAFKLVLPGIVVASILIFLGASIKRIRHLARLPQLERCVWP
ncbi:carbohydrate ABC transporter permease [Paenibacillus doosanensis]|nr:carbohydrate ABC transporter permease [Paenibacillus doosanensis]